MHKSVCFALKVIEELLANSPRGPRALVGCIGRHVGSEDTMETKIGRCRARLSSHLGPK